VGLSYQPHLVSKLAVCPPTMIKFETNRLIATNPFQMNIKRATFIFSPPFAASNRAANQ
jgi:hypothetical protein